MMKATLPKFKEEMSILNDNFCAATSPVSRCEQQVASKVYSENSGCVFKVGNEMYFVPTQHVADEDMLYITCDAQKIEGPLDDWRTRLFLGDIADGEVEDAILDHLLETSHAKPSGEAFVVTRDGKTFRL